MNRWGDRTPLSAGRVAELLEVCLKSTYFSYGGDFYEQTQGAAMGSPVSAIVANLYMEFFEELALGSTPVKLRLWKQYVDDTYCIVKRGMAEELLDHLNSVRPSIQSTLELEREGSLIPGHLVAEKGGRHPRHLCLPETDAD